MKENNRPNNEEEIKNTTDTSKEPKKSGSEKETKTTKKGGQKAGAKTKPEATKKPAEASVEKPDSLEVKPEATKKPAEASVEKPETLEVEPEATKKPVEASVEKPETLEVEPEIVASPTDAVIIEPPSHKEDIIDDGKLVWQSDDSPTEGILVAGGDKGGGRKKLLAIGGIIVGIILILAIALGVANSSGPLKLKVDTSEDFKNDGTFVLSGLKGYSASDIKENLEIIPETKFEVEKSAGGKFDIRLKGHRNIAYGAVLHGEDEAGDRTELISFKVNDPAFTVMLLSKQVGNTEPITLKFNQQVDPRSVEQHLTIMPKTAYTLKYDLDTVSIIPDVEWVITSQYSISLDAGTASRFGKEFVENQVMSFSVSRDTDVYDDVVGDEFNEADFYSREQEQEENYGFNYDDYNFEDYNMTKEEFGQHLRNRQQNAAPYSGSVQFLSDSDFIITENIDMRLFFTAGEISRNIPVEVAIYYLGDVERYKDKSEIYLDYNVDLTTLEKQSTEMFLIKSGLNQFDLGNPGEGAYVIVSTLEGESGGKEEHRTGYLVTPYSVYMQSSKDETLVWIQNSVTGGPAANFVVTFNDDEEHSGTTNADGIAVIPHLEYDEKLAEAQQQRYQTTSYSQFSVADSAGTIVYYDDANIRQDTGHSRDIYYSYLFIDRTIYRPKDTMSFWGFVKPFRDNKAEMPKTVTAVFDEETLDIRVEVAVDANGAFHGEIPLEKIKDSQYIFSTFMTFPPDEEDKPEYSEAQLAEMSTEEREQALAPLPDTRVSLNYEYVSVREFTKPSYTLESTVEREFYGPDDKVTIKATPAFYDGTPLPNFPLEVHVYNTKHHSWERIESEFFTDETGSATISFDAIPAEESYNKDPVDIGLYSNYYRVQISTDGEHITSVGEYLYLNSDMLVEQKIAKQDDDTNLYLDFFAYKVDLSTPAFRRSLAAAKASGDMASAFTQKNLLDTAKGEGIDTTLNIALRWLYTDKDDITHENRRRNLAEGYIGFNNSYNLDYTVVPDEELDIVDDWETQEKRIKVETKDGKARVNDLIYLAKDGDIDFDEPVACMAETKFQDSYLTFRATSSGYPEAEKIAWEAPQTQGEDKEVVKPKGYTFKIIDQLTEEDLTPPADYYRRVTIGADSPTSFQLLKDGDPVEGSGKILYTIIQGGLYHYSIVDANQFTFQYLTDYGQQAQLVAAYFDGERVHYIKDLELLASTESFNINIDVEAEKDSYRPGETVRLDVNATDYLGKGVAGNLCISVVDESIFTLSPQSVDPLFVLYQNFSNMDNYVTKYCTTYRNSTADIYGTSGGKGGGDGMDFYDSYRENFKDTAVFIPTRTDSSGRSSVEFKLPDNTTSWRITAVEIGDDLRAGHSKTNLISTLPFFVKPVTSDKYIEGDEISMLVQGHGVILEDGSKINYTVNLKGDGVNETLTSSGSAYEPWEFNFGALPIGSYTIEAKAQFSGYSDTVVVPVSVIKSNLELVVSKPVTLKSGKVEIDALRYPVTISTFSKDHEGFFASINSLFGHYCMQPSQRLSRFVAKRVIRQSVEDGTIPYYIAEGNDSVSDMQQYDGGIGPSAGTNSEGMLSMYLTLIADDQFERPALINYFKGKTDSGKDYERAAAYLGLAKLKGIEVDELYKQLGITLVSEKADPEKMVLKYITYPDSLTKKEARETDKLSIRAQAYYVAALAYLEDTEIATQLYSELLSEYVSNIQARNDYDYRELTEENINWEIDAASIWIASTLLNQQHADDLSIHFGSYSWRFRSLFEAMIYVTNYDRPVKQIGYNYTLDGKTNYVDLGTGSMHTMVLSESDLKDLTFSSVPDEVRVVAYYVGEPSEIDITPSNNMSVAKVVTQINKDTYKVTVSLNLNKDAPGGEYNISDWIPTNSRMYNSSSSTSNVEHNGQKVYITHYHTPTGKDVTVKFEYEIRQTYRASAMLDTVYVIHGETGENCNSQKTAFVPKSDELKLPMVHVDPLKSIASQVVPKEDSESVIFSEEDTEAVEGSEVLPADGAEADEQEA